MAERAEGAAAPPAVVLLSGGLDSATTLARAVREGFSAHALTVDYGQRHVIEIERAKVLSRELGATDHRIVRLDLRHLARSALTDPSAELPQGSEPTPGIPPTYVPARNTLLLSLALAWGESLGARDLFIGANAIDYGGYPDCRPEFLEAFERLARLGTKSGIEGRPLRVRAPLLRMTKAEIILEARRLGVPLGETVSCYAPGPDGRPCRRCDACLLRARGFRQAGLDDPAL